jgi:hypothetical protein
MGKSYLPKCFFSFSVPLDKPEQCLLDLSRIDHFVDRVDCLVFKKQFNEQLGNFCTF